MQLDPKYFNKFLAIVAVLAALLIAFFTLNSQQDRRTRFKKEIVQQDSLRTISWLQVGREDSLAIADFNNRFVLLNFWSHWSDPSTADHQKLAGLHRQYRDLVIISALVGFRKEEAQTYIQSHSFPFRYVAGSQQFSDFGVPGLPAYLLYRPGGKLEYVSLGTLDKVALDSLRTLLDNGT